MMFGKQNNNNEEGLRALEEQLNKFEAERKTLYSIIDKLTGCIEETNRRFEGLVSQVESLENRITDMELKYDTLEEEEEMDEE